MSELHLFIIWSNARSQSEIILTDLALRFQILQVYEVFWSSHSFAQNLTRFYGMDLPPGCHKEDHCGNGPFLLVIVRDDHPDYQPRLTSKGNLWVNANTFDAKTLYRHWTGGGHRIHATNSIPETHHDLALLLGVNPVLYTAEHRLGWDSIIRPWKHDLVGTNGWDSLRQLFTVLNATMDYLVLRNFYCLPDAYYAANHGDIDLLVADYQQTCYLTNSKAVFAEANRVLNTISIKGTDVLFDFRHLGDNYYDQIWQQDMLNTKVLTSNIFYHPNLEHYFYSLLYHAHVHKHTVSPDYLELLPKLAEQVGIVPVNADLMANTAFRRDLLDKFMQQHGYRYVRPKDPSVYFRE